MRIGFALTLLLALAASPAFGCEPPDDLDRTPWRAAVARVKYLPETEAWADAMQRERSVVQYVVLLDESRYVDGRCYWPVELRAAGKVWKRFLVTPDGSALREDKPR